MFFKDVKSTFSQKGGFEQFGPSPWLNLSDKAYTDGPNATTLWGSTLQYVFKFAVNGDDFRFIDKWKIQELPFFVQWNFAMLPGGRMLVPAPNGLQSLDEASRATFEQCASTTNNTPAALDSATLLIFDDGNNVSSPIRCVDRFEVRREQFEQACGLSGSFGEDVEVVGLTAVGTDVLYNGDIGVRIQVDRVREDPSTRATYLAIIDAELDDSASNPYRACTLIGDGAPTNGAPILPEGNNGSRIYFALPDSLVELVYNPSGTPRLQKTGEAPIDFRADRTGTTPSILFASDGSKWIVTIDARCAFENPFSGTIECDRGLPPEELPPSRLVAFKLPFAQAPSMDASSREPSTYRRRSIRSRIRHRWPTTPSSSQTIPASFRRPLSVRASVFSRNSA